MLTVTHIYKIYSFPPSLKTFYDKVEFFARKCRLSFFCIILIITAENAQGAKKIMNANVELI